MSTDDPKHLVRTRGSTPMEVMHVRHPFNPRSDVRMTLLSDPTGLKRLGVTLARVPPGKESFIPHAHTINEEWVFVLEGHGTALLGERRVEIGPGDFLGFPTDGTVHHLENTGTEDLVFLQGGERHEAEVGHFPTLGKLGLHLGNDTMGFVDEAHIQRLPFSAWDVAPDDPEPSRD